MIVDDTLSMSSVQSSPLSEMLATPAVSPKMPSLDLHLLADLPAHIEQQFILALAPKAAPVALAPSIASFSTQMTARKTSYVRPPIPLDAPVQPRKYSGPSATSRKEPPSLKRKAHEMDPALDDKAEKKRYLSFCAVPSKSLISSQ